MTHTASAALNFLELLRLNEQRVLVAFGSPECSYCRSMEVISVERPPVILPRPMLVEMANLDPGEYDEPLARVTFATDIVAVDPRKYLTLEVFNAGRLTDNQGISLHVGFGRSVYVSPLDKPTPREIAQMNAMLDISAL
jgi:hypothetical protein